MEDGGRRYCTAIILAAGSGSRLKSKVSKPLVCLNGKPLLRYSLDTLYSHPLITDVIVTCNAGNERGLKRLIRSAGLCKKKLVCVRGGDRRQDSVRNALEALDPRCSIVLIHDGGRPFVDAALITRVIRAACVRGAAIAAVPVKATVKEVEGRGSKVVGKTLDRALLWEVQTPQVFEKNLIIGAFRRFGAGDVTDDASLVEKANAPVELVESSYFNIKVTTPEDLVLAQAIARHRKYHV